jgi:hypothetical protein
MFEGLAKYKTIEAASRPTIFGTRSKPSAEKGRFASRGGAPATVRESSGARTSPAIGCALATRRADDRQQVSAGARASPSWSGGRRRPTHRNYTFLQSRRTPSTKHFLRSVVSAHRVALPCLTWEPIAGNLEVAVVGRRHEPEAKCEAPKKFMTWRLSRDS